MIYFSNIGFQYDFKVYIQEFNSNFNCKCHLNPNTILDNDKKVFFHGIYFPSFLVKILLT